MVSLVNPSLRTIIATGLISTFKEIPELVTAFTDPVTGDFKAALGAAPGNWEMPYIRINHTFGGERNETPKPSFDHSWSIGVCSPDQSIAEQWDAYIKTRLIRQRITLGFGWGLWADITFEGEIANLEQEQQAQFWHVGGYYRIRGIKES